MEMGSLKTVRWGLILKNITIFLIGVVVGVLITISAVNYHLVDVGISISIFK